MFLISTGVISSDRSLQGLLPVMSIDLPLFPLTPYLAYPISTAQIAYLGRLTVAVAVEAEEMRAPCLMRQSQSGVAFAFIVVIGIKAAFPASLETSRISKWPI
jgi:hypothetical protein